MKKLTALFALLCPIACSTVADVGSETKTTPASVNGRWWAVEFGAFQPQDSELRDAFGDVLFRVGFRPYESKNGGRLKTRFDVSVLSASRNGNHFFAVPTSIGLIGSTGNRDSKQSFFYGAGVGPAFVDYDIDRGAESFRGSRFAWSAHGEAGVSIERRLTLQLRYDWISRQQGFDFGGFSLNVSYAAVKW